MYSCLPPCGVSISLVVVQGFAARCGCRLDIRIQNLTFRLRQDSRRFDGGGRARVHLRRLEIDFDCCRETAPPRCSIGTLGGSFKSGSATIRSSTGRLVVRTGGAASRGLKGKSMSEKSLRLVNTAPAFMAWTVVGTSPCPAPSETKVSSILSSNCFGPTLRA